MKTDQDLIFEAYMNGDSKVEQDDNDQFAPEEASNDQTNEIQPLEDEEDNVKEIAKQLGDIVDQLRTLNQYANVLTTGTRTQSFDKVGN